jgi:hypothetical protein
VDAVVVLRNKYFYLTEGEDFESES